jgi:YVTN family beta-propeller protein
MALFGSLLAVGVSAPTSQAAAASTKAAPAKTATTTFAFVVEGPRVWVADAGTRTVRSSTQLPTVEGGYARNTVASPDGTRLYVAYSPMLSAPDGFWNAVAVIDVATKAVVQMIQVDDGINLGYLTGALAINPAGTRLYTSIPDLNEVEVIDIAASSVVARIDMGATAGPQASPSNITVSPDGTRVYVANVTETYGAPPGKVAVIDAATNAVIHTIDTDPYPFDVAFSPDGSKAYIATYGTDTSHGDGVYGTVQTFNTADYTATARVVVDDRPNSNPAALAVSPDGLRIYVAVDGYPDPNVAIPALLRTIDTTTNTIVPLDDTPIPFEPRKVRLNPNGDRAYVVGAELTVLDTTVHTPDGLGQIGAIPVSGYDLALVSCASRVCDSGPRSTRFTDPAGPGKEEFGADVDISGNTAVVGTSNLNNGAVPGSAYIYVKVNGKWALQATLHAPDAQPGDQFGEAVAISGNTVVVGGSKDYGGPAGSAYVFVRKGTTWSERAHLTASDGVPDNRFGISVDIDGNRIVVGAANGSAPGAVYVFERAGGVWSETARLHSSEEYPGVFGYSVAISGGRIDSPGNIVVADLLAYTADENTTGAAYVFSGSGSAWSQQAKLTSGPVSGQSIKFFGRSVDIDKDRVVVGMPNIFEAANGSAFVFAKAGGTWEKQAQLTASDTTCINTCGDRFGWSVSISDRTVMVGSPWADIGFREDTAGRAYIYEQPLNATTWPEKYRLQSPYDPRGNFGYAVAIDGTTAGVGAMQGDASYGAGYAWMFTGLI